MARLRSLNGLGQEWLLLCQEGHAWFSFSRESLPCLLIVKVKSVEKHEMPKPSLCPRALIELS